VGFETHGDVFALMISPTQHQYTPTTATQDVLWMNGGPVKPRHVCAMTLLHHTAVPLLDAVGGTGGTDVPSGKLT